MEDLSPIKTVINEKDKELCMLIEANIYQCNVNTICSPIQANIENLMEKYPQYAIMTPSVQFNSVFYGTNFLDIFEVQFEN